MEKIREVLAIIYYYLYWLKICIEDAKWRARVQSWSLDGFWFARYIVDFSSTLLLSLFSAQVDVTE